MRNVVRQRDCWRTLVGRETRRRRDGSRRYDRVTAVASGSPRCWACTSTLLASRGTSMSSADGRVLARSHAMILTLRITTALAPCGEPPWIHTSAHPRHHSRPPWPLTPHAATPPLRLRWPGISVAGLHRRGLASHSQRCHRPPGPQPQPGGRCWCQPTRPAAQPRWSASIIPWRDQRPAGCASCLDTGATLVAVPAQLGRPRPCQPALAALPSPPTACWSAATRIDTPHLGPFASPMSLPRSTPAWLATTSFAAPYERLAPPGVHRRGGTADLAGSQGGVCSGGCRLPGRHIGLHPPVWPS